MSNSISFICDCCGREVYGCNIVNGMKFCAKCYQETFGETDKDKQIAELQKQLEEKDKYTYTGKEVGEIERKYDEKIDTLEQKLKSQPVEIVEKIKEQIFNHFNVKNIEEYERLPLLNALFTADAIIEIYRLGHDGNDDYSCCIIPDDNDVFFATKEEAEQKLAEIGGKDE